MSDNIYTRTSADENNGLMIKIENVRKQYRLGTIGGGTLRGDLQSWWAKVRGREDPNSEIGAKVYKKNEKFMALDGINLEVKKGERLGIIGHNGAGKSTLLKILSRVTAPTEGKIFLNGRISSMLEVGTGFHAELTGRENIYLNGAILGMTRAEVDSKIERIIDFSECGQFIDTPVKRYSSGMYVKLAFSVAAHLDSEILVMDEVLAVGDMKFQQKCLDKMNDVSREDGRTILYVSHNMNTIRQLCTRCIVLDHGKLIFDGDVEKAIGIYMDLSRDESVEADYVPYIRPNWIQADNLRLCSAKFINKDVNSFYREEKIKIEYNVRYSKALETVGLRFEVRMLDGTAVATAVSENIPIKCSDRVQSFSASYDVSNLVEGVYKTYYTFFTYNEYGNYRNIDCVPGLQFSIVPPDERCIAEWDGQQWGFVQLPSPETKPERSELNG